MAQEIQVIDLGQGKRTDLPGGNWVCELVSQPLNQGHTVVGFSTWKPGAPAKQIVHETEEIVFIVSGKGKYASGSKVFPFHAWQTILIPAGVPHGVVNDSGEDVTMVYIFSNPEYPATRTVEDSETD